MIPCIYKAAFIPEDPKAFYTLQTEFSSPIPEVELDSLIGHTTTNSSGLEVKKITIAETVEDLSIACNESQSLWYPDDLGRNNVMT